jgi:hypothetical protein
MVDDTVIGSAAKTFGEAFKNFGIRQRLSNYLFTSIAKKGMNAGIKDMDIEKARDWFRNEAIMTAKADPKKMIATAGDFERLESLSANSIGKLYMMSYDAKHKDTLPYWDKFPLFFPIQYYSDSILSINLHYLPPTERAKLMNALYETLNNEKYNKTSKLQISYEILKNSSKLKSFKPCVKKHLFSQIRSPIKIIKIEYWDYATLLPSERFVGASKEKVWRDSMNSLK